MQIVKITLDLLNFLLYNNLINRLFADISLTGGYLRSSILFLSSKERVFIMKGKLITAVCIILLFLPTYIAVGFYINAQNSPVSDNVVGKMTLSDIDGETFTFIRDSEETEPEMISFFVKMNDNAVPVDNLPEPLRNTPAYTANYYSYNLETTYKYYFTTDPGDAYMVDNEGRTYEIAEDDAKIFISSKYAVSLYKEAAAPVMTLSGISTILPQSMTWKYRLRDNVYSDAVVPMTDVRDTFVLAGTLNLSFDIEPDYLFVTILNGEEMIFSDLYSNISAAVFNENAALTVGVKAEWYEDEERGSYGEATYTFIMDVQAPAEFYLGVSQIEQGEFVAVTGKNVKDPSAITFVSAPDINFTPVFYRDGEYVVALVPVSYDLEYSPTYKFMITSGDSVTELTLGVIKKEFKWRDYDVPAEIIATTRTDSLIKAYNDAVEPYLTASEPVRYWLPQTNFVIPAQGTDMVKAGIGIYRTLTATGLTYRNPGVDFLVTEGTNVLAAYDGKIAYAGTQTMSGRIIIIEHGFGLKSVYWHMSSVSVVMGDPVKAGDVIGVVGSTGFTKGTNLHYGLYIFGTPVSPYDLWGWDETTNAIVVATP